LTPIASVFSAIGSIGDYFEGLLSVWAVINGFINSTGLVLAFALKMDRFTPTVPLTIVPPRPSEGFNKLELNYKIKTSIIIIPTIIRIIEQIKLLVDFLFL
jgi:hypothetical protein